MFLLPAAMSALVGCAARQVEPSIDGPAGMVSNADIATFNEAVSLTQSLHFDEAVLMFNQVAGRFASAGNRSRAAEALFWLAFCREKQSRTAEAREIYEGLLREYPGTSAAREAGERLSRLK